LSLLSPAYICIFQNGESGVNTAKSRPENSFVTFVTFVTHLFIKNKNQEGNMSNHKSVVRNQGHTRGAAGNVECHNERKNKNYSNADVILEQSHRNVHFKMCDGTYLGAFDKMVQDGEISTRGLKLNNEGTKPESSIMAEMVFDVNTEYFESNYGRHGYDNGYDFARDFYAEAYKMAVAEVGDEKYILSAVLHADERNKGLSEKLGRDVYHYHLHVVYIPVVQKEIKWTKKCKDKSLIGKVKEVINQVNHSKKWECEKELGEDGKERLVYSYSKLQDRYHDHMKAAGFEGFERGKVGSTAEHLSVLDYKTKVRQDELAEREKELLDAEKELEQKSVKLTTVNDELAVFVNQLSHEKNRLEKQAVKEKDIQGRIKYIEDSGQLLTLKQIEKIPTKIYTPIVGNPGVILSEEDEKNLRKMAMMTAKAKAEARAFQNMVKKTLEAIRDIVQAVGLLKFNFKSDFQPIDNLTLEQNILIAAILKYGVDISKFHGYDKLAEEMSKAKFSKPMLEKFNRLEEEYQKKNRPPIKEVLQAARLKANEYNETNNIISKINQEHKSRGESL
jgi:hypothetical protein